MKRFLAGFLVGMAGLLTGLAAPDLPLAKLRAVPFTDVKIADAFWAPKLETNRLASIPVNLENLEKSGNLGNLRLAAQKATQGFQGPVFMDSDVYKALEAAAYALSTHPDPALAARLDEIIGVLAGAQQPDGYLNSYFVVKEPDKRWKNLRDWHELYCAGHMFEAAVAHYQATGKRNFLNIAIKKADCIDSVFGPAPKRMGYPGHPEIELALVKLWRATGEQRYFNLARFFVENRGRKFFAEEHNTPLDRYDGTYWQDDVPICDHRNIKGHAVRAAYLMSGATDVAGVVEDAGLLKMLSRVWRNTTERNMYITGGIGPSSHNEGFTEDYDLPNLTAYQETCATIALAQWNHRLALLYGHAKYADVVERALYNGAVAGVSLDGTKFFYVNPLESRGTHHRSPWFGCACCPPNVARTLASLGGYACATSDDGLYVNLYIQGSARTTLRGQKVALEVATDYPWDGRVTLKTRLATPTQFKLHLRIPSWCASYRVEAGQKAEEKPATDHGYLVLDRSWKDGDQIRLVLDMPVAWMEAHPKVKADHGLRTIQRGPLLYCLEQCDHDVPLDSIYLPSAAVLHPRKASRLGGVVVLEGLLASESALEWTGQLYQPSQPPGRPKVTAIPYYAWDNRAPGPMKVWLPVAPPVPKSVGLEGLASVTVSFANANAQPGGINDGVEPKSSGEQPAALCHWWPHRNSAEWVQYTWPKPVTVNRAQVYWFDDTGRGACRLPQSWLIEYRDGNDWKPVAPQADYPIALDKWCEVAFTPVTTTALRLAVKLQKDWAGGAHEWKVTAVEDE